MNPRKKTRILVPLNPDHPLPPPGILKRSFIFVITTFLRPIFFLIGRIYKICFGWLDASQARKNQEEFSKEIHGQLQFLFSEHKGRIVANDPDVPFPPSLDGAYVTVECDTVRFQFIRGRGDFTVRVAPLSAPTEWEELGLVLATISDLPVEIEPRDFCVLRTVARLLPLLYEPLGSALQVSRSKDTLDRAVSIHNERTEDYIARLKQNGIVPKIF